MDDSDQEFSFLCSRLLKRVRRKAGDSREEKKTDGKGDEDKDGGGSGARCSIKAASKRKREKKGALQSKGTAAISAGGCEAEPEAGQEQKEKKVRAKEKVLSRMQQFKRVNPPRLLHTEGENPVGAQTSREVVSEPSEEAERDEVVALRLQQQLNGEAEKQVVNVEDGGLFFCQLCYRDLSAMSHQLRTQHINRCLDESESSTSGDPPAPPPPPDPRSHPHVPGCPICGRSFKSEKTRSAHLKRCSVSMGVSPAELLEALHRQAAENQSQTAAEPRQQAGGSSDTSDSNIPARKKARRKAPCMDEDTMVALALSRSLLEQEKEKARERAEEIQIQALLSTSPSAPPALQKLPGAGKIRGKRKKAALSGPPPLLLLQDPQTAWNRIQERVSSMLLRPRPPTPPTPTLLPSTLTAHTHGAPLWLKSVLPGGGPTSFVEFYTAELSSFIQPWIKPENQPSLCTEVTPVKRRSANPSQILTAHPFVSGTPGTPGTQALQDLEDLAEEGMTLTQCRDTGVAEASLSGFVPEPAETSTPPVNQVSVWRLCSDLSSMVNNPQLSDVQMQVDSGEIYYAHSFMLYTRCPLLANMVHDEGFGVQEEGFPKAQRILLNDVSGDAVLALLQYLYTAVCPLVLSLLPHVHQLAIRFGLVELQQQCQQYTDNPESLKEEIWNAGCAQELAVELRQSLADTQFMELLRSMWEHEESDGEESGEARGRPEGEEKACGGDGDREEVVDEEELDEIYEFAATQRKLDAGAGSESPEDEDDEDQDGASSSPADVNCVKTSGSEVKPNTSTDAGLDRRYSRLFSESWGKYTEPPPSQACQTPTPAPRRLSSVSDVIDLSISLSPVSGEPGVSVLPVTGVSPGEDGEIPDRGSERFSSSANEDKSLALEPESASAPTSITLAVSPPPPTSPPSNPRSDHNHIELIILSDCSDDMDVDPPAVLPPQEGAQSTPSYTHTERAEAQPPEKPVETPDHVQPVGHESVLDGSAEVSWLIPATPEPSTRSSSTQTCSSMRRTQLFPTSHLSSSSENRTQGCNYGTPGPSPAFHKNVSHPRLSQTSLGANSAPQPCSSTPIHSDPPRHTLDLLGSPSLRNDEPQTQRSGQLRSLRPSPSENSASPCRRSERSEAAELEPEASCVRNSFFDEPPIAFDDSWGLGGALPEQAPCFSLKLDSSEDPGSPPHKPPVDPHRPSAVQPDPDPPCNVSMPDAEAWDSWDEEDHAKDEAAAAVPLHQRLGAAPLAKRVAQLKTPVNCRKKNQAPLVPITPMPSYSDMDTPELKNRLNRFGVRPLPKKQMVLKLKEIHQYTHQLMSSSSSEEEASPRARPKPTQAHPAGLTFKKPAAPPHVSPRKLQFNEEEQDVLPLSQESNSSNASSTAESDRSNPELCESEDDGSDAEDVTASQAAVREKDKLLAVRSFILSDPLLYSQVLQYQPLSLCDLKARLRTAGIRLATTKLLDFLDSQCITFTTAKPGQPSRRRARGGGRGRKRVAKVVP